MICERRKGLREKERMKEAQYRLLSDTILYTTCVIFTNKTMHTYSIRKGLFHLEKLISTKRKKSNKLNKFNNN